MPQGREDSWDTAAVDTHSLLLSLAGLLDDELLGWCRELVAVGEGDYAVELVTSAVQADGVRLPVGTHELLHAAASRRALLGRGEALPPADTAPKMRHRFLADPAAGGVLVAAGPRSPQQALAAVPSRLLRDCQLWLSWRCTPAGAAPGPLPHPVVLIEADEADGAEVLAYQVGEVLLRAGVFASVEVFAPGIELGDYHRAALAEAHLVDLTAVRPSLDGAGEVGRSSPGMPSVGGAFGAAASTPDVASATGVANATGGATATGAEPLARRRPDSPRSDSPRPGPLGSPEDSRDGRPTPLRPVDRVIAARSSTPRPPRPGQADRADTGFDEIAAGLTFDRPPTPVDDPPRGGDPDAAETSRRDGVTEPPPSERRPPPAPPGNPERRPGPRPAPPGPGGFPAAPDRGRPPGGGSGKRPLGRPDDRPSEAPLSEVEQRLLRQLHEELSAREDEASPGPAARRIFRNGGRKPRPNPPDDTPPAS
jgi:hypothetical protein